MKWFSHPSRADELVWDQQCFTFSCEHWYVVARSHWRSYRTQYNDQQKFECGVDIRTYLIVSQRRAVPGMILVEHLTWLSSTLMVALLTETFSSKIIFIHSSSFLKFQIEVYYSRRWCGTESKALEKSLTLLSSVSCTKAPLPGEAAISMALTGTLSLILCLSVLFCLETNSLSLCLTHFAKSGLSLLFAFNDPTCISQSTLLPFSAAIWWANFK